ncbi:MAG: glutamine synthetase III [Sphaerochaetaceae bacterium]|nr:glutamine synthetase III [Sphaerochaetaceae bacterium]
MKETINVPEMFASHVFTEKTMKKYISEEHFKLYRTCIETGKSLPMDTADAIAEGMKNWAISLGATHYTHWFQPLNGGTAEKHESFIAPDGKGSVIMEFSGKELVKGEPDASSFPSGGLRATFEARGYSAWDPTSHAFVYDGSLCIPTMFFSYSGEALDKKTPLLRSVKALNTQAVRVLRILGDTETSYVTPMAGAEQEYFLLDKEMFEEREDLKICGRTLFGSKPPKTQQLEDHYFGSIKPRVSAFMKDLEAELWKLGIPAKTKHNEVAPSQHEMAPVYCDCNTSNDQNQLTMNLMRRVADRHGLVCVLSEKPFDGVNGSGKHNNWSIATDRGENLFSPGKTPDQNARFLLFLSAFIAATDDYQELLRCSVSYAGNDNRLGGNEAPPAIISVFIGAELQAVVDSIVTDSSYNRAAIKPIKVGIDSMPVIPRDTTDRNRTSPIAFTGNKFEFRMPGSSQSISGPNVILNTIVAEKLGEYADRLSSADERSLKEALHDLVKSELTKHSRIVFNGNGYDSSWIEEAKERRLSNLRTTADALPCYLTEKNIALMEKHKVLSRSEMIARDEIHVEKYCKTISIEASTLIDMAQREIIPAVSAFEEKLCSTALKRKDLIKKASLDVETTLCRRLAESNTTLMELLDRLNVALSDSPEFSDYASVRYFHDEVLSLMNQIREVINLEEVLVPESYWPYPSYRQLLFSV